MVIYRVTNKINGKQYVGQTISTIEKRWSKHCRSGNALHAAIKKYGKDNFSIASLGEYDNLEDLNTAEEYFINYYNTLSPEGYNLHSGGYNHKPSEETRKKQSDSHKGLPTPWLFGKKASEETRAKQSAAKKGKAPWNKGLKGKQKAWNKGIPMTAESRAKMIATKRAA